MKFRVLIGGESAQAVEMEFEEKAMENWSARAWVLSLFEKMGFWSRPTNIGIWESLGFINDLIKSNLDLIEENFLFSLF